MNNEKINIECYRAGIKNKFISTKIQSGIKNKKWIAK
jgi:hypothetical protein